MAKTIAFLISTLNEAGEPPARPLAAYAREAERDFVWDEVDVPEELLK